MLTPLRGYAILNASKQFDPRQEMRDLQVCYLGMTFTAKTQAHTHTTHTMATILNVYLTSYFPDNTLRDCIRAENTCFWRISDENLLKCTHVRIWAEPEVSSCLSDTLCAYTAPITSWKNVQLLQGMHRIIEFTNHGATFEERDDRPVMNRGGWVITEE